MLWKHCTQYARKFGKLSSGHRTGKGQFSFQSLRKTMPKNVQTTTQLHSSHMLVMFKILQARLQQYINRELPDVQAGFRKGRGTRGSNCQQSLDHRKSKSSRKTSIAALLTMPKPLIVWITINCGKFWKRWEYQTIWPASWEIYAGLEATIRTGHGTTDRFQIGKGVCQGCILSPCLFHLYAEYIIRNAELEEVQAGIKIAGRNINSLR